MTTVILTLLGMLIGFPIGMVIGRMIYLAFERRARPYRYTCPEPGCTFRVKASEPVPVIILTDRHRKAHQEAP